jgi:hypothetical protein
MKAINSKNSINSMNPTNTTTINEESYNIMDVPTISLLKRIDVPSSSPWRAV